MSTGQNKNCGKCEKVVYPAEEIKCLDKFWHKGCLKCTVCGMTLNVKNVKGYDKMPYCHVHYPQPKPTVVADNPEMQRIRLLTDIQSNAKYHEDFNKSKGKFTVVADDPAMTRAKEQQRIVSQAEYTGKRKESSTQLIGQDHPQPNGTTKSHSAATETASVGRVADYDPLNDDRGSLARGYEPTSKAMHSTKFEVNPKAAFPPTHSQQQQGNGNKVSSQTSPPEQPLASNVDPQMRVRALYSYTAAESDEISFNEGDLLDQCEHIDAGWMFGRNPKTGHQGLLPSNYVEILSN